MVTQAPLATLAAKNQAINNKVGLLCEAPHSTTMVDCHLKSRELLRSYVHYAYCCSCFVTTHLRLRRVATKCWESHWPFSPKTEYEYCHKRTAKIFIRNASLLQWKRCIFALVKQRTNKKLCPLQILLLLFCYYLFESIQSNHKVIDHSGPKLSINVFITALQRSSSKLHLYYNEKGLVLL